MTEPPIRSPAEIPAAKPRPLPYLLSAPTDAGLRDQARQLATHLHSHPNVDLRDVALSLATHRTHFAYRAVVTGTERGDLLSGLGALAAGEPAANLTTGTTTVDCDSLVFVFPGQGAQWAGMGRELLSVSHVFRRQVQDCADALAPYLGWSVIDVLGDADGAGFSRVDVVQPALFAMMVGLAELWKSLGVRPAALVGHSQGEIAAAYIAGGLSLPDAARIVALRAQALTTLSGTGGMVSVPLSTEQTEHLLGLSVDELSIAARNAPATTIVSGDRDAISAFAARCASYDVLAKVIPVDYASHTAHADAICGPLRDALASITPRTNAVPLVSTVTGEYVDTATMDADYWCNSLRRTVQFAPAVGTLLADGYRAFLEVSPHPILTPCVRSILYTADTNGVVAPTLRRDQGGWLAMVSSLAQMHTRGVSVKWKAILSGKRVDLPTYPFERQRFWPDPHNARRQALSADSPFSAPSPHRGDVRPSTDPA